MKNAKVIIPILLGVLVGGLGVGIFLWNKQAKTVKPASKTQASHSTNTSVELVTWTDQAGFTFQYPKNISVNPHEEDTVNYAHVELTHKDHPGRIIVWMKDLPAPDLAGWMKKEKRFAGASVLDTTLGGKSAKKILIADPIKMIVVGTLDADVFVTVEGELTDADFWSKTHQTIMDSFVFSGTDKKTDTAPASSDGSSDANVTEEEVVE